MEDETAAQLTCVMFRDFGPEVDALVFGSLLAQSPVPLLLLLLLLQARSLGRRGWAHLVLYSRVVENGARNLLGCVYIETLCGNSI